MDDKPTLVIEGHNSEDDSDELQMSSCREPAAIIFGPFQDHPHPPIGNILVKAFNNNNNNDTKLKGEPTTYPLF